MHDIHPWFIYPSAFQKATIFFAEFWVRNVWKSVKEYYFLSLRAYVGICVVIVVGNLYVRKTLFHQLASVPRVKYENASYLVLVVVIDN